MGIKIGHIYDSKSCGKFEVIYIESYRKIKVRFIITGFEVWVQGGQVTDGRISDKLSPTVYGVGRLGLVEGNPVDVKCYKIWHSMIQRCYSDNYKTREKSRSYNDVTVCKEWLTYTTFRDWFNINYKEGYYLDKDLTVLGSREYNPESCSFIPNEINCLLLNAGRNRGKYPIGVHLDKGTNKYAAQVSVKGESGIKKKFLGYHETPEEAFQTYKHFKENWVKSVAERSYKAGDISKKIYENLKNYSVEPY